jgi:transaldolase / glucose-6-phosphate isomerase
MSRTALQSSFPESRLAVENGGVANPLLQLIDHGQSYWLDNLSRTMIRNGDLERRVTEQGLRGITSNPTIFDSAITKGNEYDEQIAQLVAAGRSVPEIYDELTVRDVRDACDILRRVYDGSGGADGFVSLEVSPYLAHDAEGSLREAKRLFAAVDRPNVLIKIPGTPLGVGTIEEALFEGININITLLFSIQSYEAVAHAYIRALERRAAAGKPIETVASVASFFLSRIDVLVDRLLAHRVRESGPSDNGFRPELLFGAAAIANAKLAYQCFKRIFTGERWAPLASCGARPQRVLWASTSTKDPLYSDVRYVEPLIGAHTVNTMPDKTVAAFGDHGIVADTLERGLDESRQVMEDLRSLGIDLDRVTWQLLNDGIQKFIEPYDDLMTTLAEKRRHFLAQHAVWEKTTTGPVKTAVAAATEALDVRRFGTRFFAGDPYLWKSQPAYAETIRNRLGWLDLQFFRDKTTEIQAFTEEVRSSGVRHVVLLGMGGSSLCAAVCGEIFGAADAYPQFAMLDDTDPAALRAIEDHADLSETLFIVASKSGTTQETLSFYRYFWNRLTETGIPDPGKHFVAITDPGTPLADEARKKGFRRSFEILPSIGGRYSAMSYFGLVPMSLLGIDIDAMIEDAEQMRLGCGPRVPAASNPAIHLGALLGMAGRTGRDKVTFVFSEALAPFASWLEQLVAESTGKEGRGLLPIADETLGKPEVYGQDRVFVSLRMEGEVDKRSEQVLAKLDKAGHPVVSIRLADRIAIGGEFFRWEIATATAGVILGVDPFDEPNVAESKHNTARLLEQWKESGALPAEAPLVEDGGIALYGDAKWTGQGRSAIQVLQAFFETAQRSDYIALLPYFHRTPTRHQALQSLRTRLRDHLKVATTLGYGPRYLHSTGQLHKGGANAGVFLIITTEADEDLAIPGEKYGFGTLHAAQALGDFRSLRDKERRVFRLHFRGDPVRVIRSLSRKLFA